MGAADVNEARNRINWQTQRTIDLAATCIKVSESCLDHNVRIIEAAAEVAPVTTGSPSGSSSKSSKSKGRETKGEASRETKAKAGPSTEKRPKK